MGKTCRLLQEGRERLRDGSDVVIGLLETHGRRETARQAEGLEQVPRRRLHHRGVELEELDVAAVLERRPQRTGQALVRERIPSWVLEQALAGYFQRANLIALRERVMMCLTTAPSAQRLLRRGFRLAAALDAPLLVLTVLDSHRLLSRD
ncbi:hypothetical protein [Vulcanococcus limneticus]|uniref:hypothetical protein n=1 Tax=Vulcanococcus limneticus TaxID=2170428 RepID=UPI00398BBF5C